MVLAHGWIVRGHFGLGLLVIGSDVRMTGFWVALLAASTGLVDPSDMPPRPPRPIFGGSMFTAKKLPPRTRPDDGFKRPAAPDGAQAPIARSVPAKQVSDSPPTQGQPPKGQPIHSREKAFRVPFSVPPLERPRLAEVQLYFSIDRGNTWKQYSAVKPDDESFTFAARGDGEYWFTVRTLDRERRLYPSTLTGVDPGLRVIVDTTPPDVSLKALDTAADQIGIEWDIADDNLDLSSLRAEFRSEASSSWYPVAIDARARGQAAWRPGVGGRIIIRLRVLDRAGNEGVKEVEVGSASSGIPAVGSGRGNQESSPSRPSPALGNSTSMPRSSGFQVPAQPNIGSSTTTDWTGANPPSPSAALNQNQGQNQNQNPNGGVNFLGNSPAVGNGRVANSNGQGRVVPYDQNERPSPQLENRSRSSGPSNVKLVNSTRFGIAYDILDKGKSGIASVKLYYTYDGRVWEEYGEDDDKKSPFNVKVNGEGTYGFTIVVKSGAGMGDEIPAPGDTPQEWVEVDTTPPDVKVGVPEVGKGAATGVLGITWSAQDRNLAPRSINLSYSENANSGWKPIANGIDNTGRYQWAVPADAPYKFYIRVEARDRAGNVGRAETDTPVIVDIARPKAKIVGVEPAGSPFKSPDLDK